VKSPLIFRALETFGAGSGGPDAYASLNRTDVYTLYLVATVEPAPRARLVSI